MKTGDALKVTFQALVVAMSTDTRFTPDELAALVKWDTDMTAGGPTTIEQDSLVWSCLKKFTAQPGNYNS